MKMKPIAQAIKEEKAYLGKLRSGEIKPINLGYRCLNESMLGGANDGDILLIGGLSSTGKSVLADNIAHHVASLNKDVRVLIFTFEMLARKLVSRKVSPMLKKTMKEIYTDNSIVDFSEYDKLKGLPIDYIEIPGTVDEISAAIMEYSNRYLGNRIFVVLDHTLLTKNRRGDTENQTLIEISAMCNELKRVLPIVFILVTQLNDAMLDVKRMLTSASHYPTQQDIFGSKYLYHVSDFVGILVNPSKLSIPGALNKRTYGYHQLPLKNSILTNAGATVQLETVYFHILKARDGGLSIEPLINALQYSTLKELSTPEYIKFCSTYNVTSYL